MRSQMHSQMRSQTRSQILNKKLEQLRQLRAFPTLPSCELASLFPRLFLRH